MKHNEGRPGKLEVIATDPARSSERGVPLPPAFVRLSHRRRCRGNPEAGVLLFVTAAPSRFAERSFDGLPGSEERAQLRLSKYPEEF